MRPSVTSPFLRLSYKTNLLLIEAADNLATDLKNTGYSIESTETFRELALEEAIAHSKGTPLPEGESPAPLAIQLSVAAPSAVEGAVSPRFRVTVNITPTHVLSIPEEGESLTSVLGGENPVTVSVLDVVRDSTVVVPSAALVEADRHLSAISEVAQGFAHRLERELNGR